MTHHLLATAAALALGACAGHAESRPIPGRGGFLPAVRVDPPPPVHIAATELATASLGGARPAEISGAPPRPRRRRATPAPSVAPPPAEPRTGRGEAGSSQVHAWREGALYRLVASPERVSAIALQPGEGLVSVAAGDTARWVIGDTVSGSGSARRTHVLVKPASAGLRTNLVISTDRRVYHVELESQARGAMTGISWTYSGGDLLALERGEDSEAGAPIASALSVEALNFGYRIEGDRPPWRPLRAFDDGVQVFIEFPPGFAGSEAPPLFVTGAAGAMEIVNYRVRGRFYVVDRLFDAAELRLGERRQQVVRITREHRRRRGGQDAR